MSSSPRVLVASTFNLGRQLYNVLTFEMCQILAQTSDADVVAPGPRFEGLLKEQMASLASTARRSAGLSRLAFMAPTDVELDYDLFLYVCLFPRQLADQAAIRGWQRRCKKSAVLILESWSSQLSREQAQLSLLDQFDHVFVFGQAWLPSIQAYTSTPCSFLAPGTDVLSATPYPAEAPRFIDVYSMGRRSEAAHRQLLGIAQRSEIFYMFDAGSGLQVNDFVQARFMTFELIRRSRYFIAYNHDVGSKAAESAGEHALPTRIFEGAAGGAVMIGSAPRCPEFEEYFGWPDSVIEIPVEPDDIRAVFRDLEAEPDRIEKARFMNATQALRRHDWVYRWEEVFSTLGFDPPSDMTSRKRTLNALADNAECLRPQLFSSR
jgi:hypothetical protein